MKLYILPYQFFEENIKLNLNIFKRETNLYQNDETLFLFYNTNQSLLRYNLMFNNFSPIVEDYDIELEYPTIKDNYFGAFRVLSKYKDLEINIIQPKNDFIKSELIYFINKLHIKEFNIKIEDTFENKSLMFFEEYEYRKEKVIFPNLIFYNIFINYLNHIIQMFFLRSTITEKLNLHKMLILMNLKKNMQSNRIKNISLLDGNQILCYRIFHEKLIKTNDNRMFTMANWDDRYLSHKFFEGLLIDIDEFIFTSEDHIDAFDILSVLSSNKIIQEMYIDLEFVNPQYNIYRAIEDIDFLTVDHNDIITGLPNWNIDYLDLHNDLIIVKEIFKQSNFKNKEGVIDVIVSNLNMIMTNLTQNYRNSGSPLGICPSCSKGYIWKSNKGFYCDNCRDFTLWNKSLETSLGFIPTKYQIKSMLSNKDQLIFTIKKNKFKLTQYSTKTNVVIWKMIKIK